MYAQRTIQQIVIDGQLSENEWDNASPAKDFIANRPINLKPEPDHLKSEVRILYDDVAIYIGAKLYDNEPNKIMKEITQRDNIGASDFFGVYINGFNDGQQAFAFFTTAAGTQFDASTSDADGEDSTWDAIWYSKVKIVEDGWIVEMKIPYAALRFSDIKEQIWGINFMREVRRDRQSYTWSPIDNNVGGFIRQSGLLKGISDIQPPTRLFFIPYLSTYFSAAKGISPDQTVKGGLDIKYGINDAFTLDAILVPDFGQAAFDNVVLNLSPFEQQFNENRPFFQEGTDLFNKGNIFYSRRIGGSPSKYPSTLDEEEAEIPSTTELLNAVKVSGRTSKGLGIGFLNAITDNTYAIIKNLETGISRKELIEPVTNYNITVFDQRFNQNSSVSLINTNVSRMHGEYQNANVTGIVWDLNNKKNSYNLWGSAKYSNIYGIENGDKGFSGNTMLIRTKGKIRFGQGIDFVTKDYNINDLGINFITNFYSFNGFVGYRILNPTKKFNNFNSEISYYLQLHKETDKFMESGINWNTNFSTKKNDWFGLSAWTSPRTSLDYYEPRVEGRTLFVPKSHGGNFWFSSNYNRKFALDISTSINNFEQNRRRSQSLNISPRYRFSDKMTVIYQFNFFKQWSDIGFTAFDDNNNIILIERDRDTFTNTISGKYAINADMTINLSIRHYWSLSEKVAFHTLQEDGKWLPNNTFDRNRNDNFNLWNFDLSYSWWIVPGSQLNILYRNNAFQYSRDINRNYGQNFNSLFEDNLSHTLSLSVRYFIDYNDAKNILKKKKA